MAEHGWGFTPTAPTLAPDRADVWWVHLEQNVPQINDLAALLPPDEQERAARFHFEMHRRHFIVAHGMLRLILAYYLNCQPEQIEFSYNAAGKPALATGEGLRFNLSHSHEMALVAVTDGREVGVDIEFVRPLDDIDRLAASTFSAYEVAAWGQLPQIQQHEGFFNCWTRKEAFIKALGQGLLYPLDQFDVSLEPGKPARLLHIAGDPQAVMHWSLCDLNLTKPYIAALVVEGQGWSLTSWKWDSTFATWNQV